MANANMSLSVGSDHILLASDGFLYLPDHCVPADSCCFVRDL